MQRKIFKRSFFPTNFGGDGHAKEEEGREERGEKGGKEVKASSAFESAWPSPVNA